ncbi:MAG TPA: restriction endonuclease subunit S [Pseudonocardiaceae bacterium]|nr:restriction endonuclease subunit S [Pseudonocardiaceae bacterium]
MRAADFNYSQLVIDSRNIPMRSVLAAQLRSKRLRKGDLIIEKSGGGERQPVGRVVRWDLDGQAVCSNFAARIRPAVGVLDRFLVYLLDSLYSAGITTKSIKQTTGIQNLDLTSYFDEIVLVPSFSGQHAIADFLDVETARIDALIAKKRCLIEKLQERFLGLVRQSVCSVPNPNDPLDIRPLDVAGQPVTPSRLVWRFRLGSGTTPRSDNGRYYASTGIPWVVTGDLRDGYIDRVDRSVTKEALADHSALVLHNAGSVVVAMYGATIGRLARMRISATVNQACCVISKAGENLPDFVFYWLLGFRRELIDRGRGAGQPNISQEMLKAIRVALPPPHTQRSIVDMLDSERAKVEGLVVLLNRQVALLQERRQVLIAAAVTEKMEIPGVSK